MENSIIILTFNDNSIDVLTVDIVHRTEIINEDGSKETLVWYPEKSGYLTNISSSIIKNRFDADKDIEDFSNCGVLYYYHNIMKCLDTPAVKALKYRDLLICARLEVLKEGAMVQERLKLAFIKRVEDQLGTIREQIAKYESRIEEIKKKVEEEKCRKH